jgi:hypothetical protein
MLPAPRLSVNGNIHATDLTAGKVALVLAFAGILGAALDLRSDSDQLRRPAAASALVAAAIVVWKSWSLTSRVSGTGLVHASVGIALWAALIGGGLALASDFVKD